MEGFVQLWRGAYWEKFFVRTRTLPGLDSYAVGGQYSRSMPVVSSWWNKLRSPLPRIVFKPENEGVAHCVGFGGAGNAGWRYHDEQVDDFAT
jgi:hypothetical protein